jgi:hypothetical protein
MVEYMWYSKYEELNGVKSVKDQNLEAQSEYYSLEIQGFFIVMKTNVQ